MVTLIERLFLGLIPQEADGDLTEFRSVENYRAIIQRSVEAIIKAAYHKTIDTSGKWHFDNRSGGIIYGGIERLAFIVQDQLRLIDASRYDKNGGVFSSAEDFFQIPVITMSFDVLSDSKERLCKAAFKNAYLGAQQDEENSEHSDYFIMLKKEEKVVNSLLSALEGLLPRGTIIPVRDYDQVAIFKKEIRL